MRNGGKRMSDRNGAKWQQSAAVQRVAGGQEGIGARDQSVAGAGEGDTPLLQPTAATTSEKGEHGGTDGRAG